MAGDGAVPIVGVYLGETLESVHRGDIVMCDRTGAVLASIGDAGRPIRVGAGRLVSLKDLAWQAAAGSITPAIISVEDRGLEPPPAELTALTAHFDGLIIPLGAGLAVASLPESTLGMAVKIEDGAARALTAALASLLVQNGKTFAEPWTVLKRYNASGRVVGVIKPLQAVRDCIRKEPYPATE